MWLSSFSFSASLQCSCARSLTDLALSPTYRFAYSLFSSRLLLSASFLDPGGLHVVHSLSYTTFLNVQGSFHSSGCAQVLQVPLPHCSPLHRFLLDSIEPNAVPPFSVTLTLNPSIDVILSRLSLIFFCMSPPLENSTNKNVDVLRSYIILIKFRYNRDIIQI